MHLKTHHPQTRHYRARSKAADFADVPIDELDVENFELEMALAKGAPEPEPVPAEPAELVVVEVVEPRRPEVRARG